MDRCTMKLYRERADRLSKRRQDDVQDQSLEYMPGNFTPLHYLLILFVNFFSAFTVMVGHYCSI